MIKRQKLSLIAGLLLVCLCITGCSAKLPDLSAPLRLQRASYAVWQEDAILYNDVIYLPLPETEEPHFDFLDNARITVCEPDVPLLLRENYGKYAFVSGTGCLISVPTDQRQAYYCREDLYESVLSALEKPLVLSEYRLYYYTNEDRVGVSGYTTNMHPYDLSAAQRDAVDGALKASPVDSIPDFNYRLSLHKRSADGLFSKKYCTVYKTTDQYWVVLEDEGHLYYPFLGESNEPIRQLFKTIMERSQVEPFDY